MPDEALPGLSRRGLFRRAILASLGVVGGVALGVRAGGYDVDRERAGRMIFLTAAELAVIDAVADRICAADVPYGSPGAPPSPREVDVAAFVDRYLAACHPSVRRDMRGCLVLVEHLWPLSHGERRRFTDLPASRQDALLAAMESASIELMRGAFFGLKSLMMMGYYRDPRTWGLLGYDGPRVARPDGGWTQLRYRPVHGSPELDRDG